MLLFSNEGGNFMVTILSISLILAGVAIIIITFLESAQAPPNLITPLFYAFGAVTISSGLSLDDEQF